MKSKTFNYKEYIGSIEFDLENQILFGKLLFINDVITYEANDLTQLEVEFKAAVNDYLETCKLLSREPQKIYRGSFNIRIGTELHREAVKAAYKTDDNLNEFCKKAIQQRVRDIQEGDKRKSATFKVHIVDSRERRQSPQTNMSSLITKFPENKEGQQYITKVH